MYVLARRLSMGQIAVTSYVPRWRGLLAPPLWLPPLVELFLKYTITFSMALAMLNAVPCYTLDGQHMVQVRPSGHAHMGSGCARTCSAAR